MDANARRQLGWLWKWRHNHDGDTTQTQIDVISQRIDSIIDAPGAHLGAHIQTLLTSTQEIGVSGELIAWTATNSVYTPSNFTAPTYPATAVTIQEDGYYNAAVRAGWVSFVAGGTVTIQRVSAGVTQTVWPPADDPGLWTTTSGQHFEGTAHAIPLLAGDTIQVFIDHNTASAVDLAYASLSLYLVDWAPTPDVASLYYDQVVLADGPDAYYRLDVVADPLPDSSGNGNHLPATGGGGGALVTGLMVDGSGNQAKDWGTNYGDDITALRFAGTAAFTVECWFTVDSTATFEALVSCMEFTGGGDNSDGWRLKTRNTGTLAFIRGDGSTSDACNESGLSADTTYHAVGTYDGTTMRLYLDGVLVDSTASSISIGDEGQAFQLGEWGPTDDLDGVLDEVAVYSRALSAAEVAHHYSVGTQGL